MLSCDMKMMRRFGLQECSDIPLNWKNIWGTMSSDEEFEFGPVVDIELSADNCLQRKFISCYYLPICKEAYQAPEHSCVSASSNDELQTKGV